MHRQRRRRSRSPGLGHAGEQCHLAVDRGLLHGNDERKHAYGALRVGNGELAPRTGPHMRVDRRDLFGFKGAEDVARDEVIDVANISRGSC
jgi:hypothetical protein